MKFNYLLIGCIVSLVTSFSCYGETVFVNDTILLTAGAIPDDPNDFNSPEIFFERWDLDFANGDPYPNATQLYGGYSRPSCFTEVYSYNGSQCISFDPIGNGSAPSRYVISDPRFKEGMPVATMMYRNDGTSNVGINYSYPLNMFFEGLFTLECIATEVGNPKYDSSSDFIPEWGYLVAVAERERGNNTIKLVQGDKGETTIGVFDANNNQLPSAYTYLRSKSSESLPKLEAKWNLDESFKYLSFYSPRNLLLLANLSLLSTADLVTGKPDIVNISDNEIIRYFTLQGMPVNQPSHGNIYIQVNGNKSKKIIYNENHE